MSKEPEKFTMAEAVDKLKQEQGQRQEQDDANMQKFARLLKEAQELTGCTLRVDPNSPLNNPAIMITVNK